MRREDDAAPPWAQPSEISFGDYVRACRTLEAGPAECLDIARLLGIALPTASETELPVKEPSELDALEDDDIFDRQYKEGIGIQEATGDTPQQEPVVVLKQKVVPSSDDKQEVPADLTPLGQALADASLNQLPDIADDATVIAPPEFIPLFEPQQTRTLLSRALARRASTGPWDLFQVIEMCARGEALTHAPRLPEPTLSSGVQLLVDRGDTMTLFAQDQSSLEQAIRKLVGNDKAQVLSFDGFPSRAGSGGKRNWKPYEEQLPPPGTVVAILGDLGIGHAAWRPLRPEPYEWRAFAERLRRRGSPVVVFVPYHPSRWPDELRRALTIIHWDRRTRTSAIRASVGSGLTVRG